jgi:hypothetical protein
MITSSREAKITFMANKILLMVHLTMLMGRATHYLVIRMMSEVIIIRPLVIRIILSAIETPHLAHLIPHWAMTTL